MMPAITQLDAAYHFIISRMVDTGQAPHYGELADHLSLNTSDGRRVMHELAESTGAVRLHPDADLIEAVPPFSSIPTQYRITVDGQQKWFGQWGFDSLAVCWLFPGKVVRIDCPCLDCNQSITVEMRDGLVLYANAPEIAGHTNLPYTGVATGLTWAQMNLFRSEEHARDWELFIPNSDEGIMPLGDWIAVFSTEGRKHLLDADYISTWRPRRAQERQEVFARLGKSGPFWEVPV